MFMRSGKTKPSPEPASPSSTSHKLTPLPHHDILALQKTHGNQAVQRKLLADIQRDDTGKTTLHVKDFEVEAGEIIINISDIYNIHDRDFSFDSNQSYDILVKTGSSTKSPYGHTLEGGQLRFSISGVSAKADVKSIRIEVETPTPAGGGTPAADDDVDSPTDDSGSPTPGKPPASDDTGQPAGGAGESGDTTSKIKQQLETEGRDAVIQQLKDDIEARHPDVLGNWSPLERAEVDQLIEIELLLKNYSIEACHGNPEVGGKFRQKVRGVLGLSG